MSSKPPSKIVSPGTGKGPASTSASPREKREGSKDPYHHGSSVQTK